MEFKEATILAGIGSLLLALSIVHWGFAIVGTVLLLIGLKYISEYYGRETIFRNALIATILAILAFIITPLTIGLSVISTFHLIVPHTGFASIFFLPLMIILLAIGFILFVISSLFFRKSMYELSDVTNEKLFTTGGLLYLVGAILTIVFGLGVIIIVIAFIIIGVAFFTIKVKT